MRIPQQTTHVTPNRCYPHNHDCRLNKFGVTKYRQRLGSAVQFEFPKGDNRQNLEPEANNSRKISLFSFAQQVNKHQGLLNVQTGIVPFW